AGPDSVWQRYLHGLRVTLAPTHAPRARKVFLMGLLDAPLTEAARVEASYRLLELGDSVLAPAGRIEVLRRLLPLAVADARLDSAYRRWSAGLGDPAIPSSTPDTVAWALHGLA